MRVLDLFSGIGGFSLGLERAGMTTVAFCEYEDFPRQVLAKHWPAVPCYPDVRTLTKEQLEADGITGIEVICGGFPCQDLSVAGRQAGISGTRSGLWSEFARLIGEIRPRFAIVENVPALLSGDSGRWFGRVLGDLAEIGYDAEWHCVPASSFGAHHQRDRAWIIAHPERIGSQGQGACWNAINPAPDSYREASGLVDAFQTQALPYVCGGHDGISPELDERRLKALGNAVIPQAPESIGRAIMEAA